jgi:hypothetical protein
MDHLGKAHPAVTVDVDLPQSSCIINIGSYGVKKDLTDVSR